MSVVLNFNDSLNNAAPVYPILLTSDGVQTESMNKRKAKHIFLCSQPRFNSESEVFILNAFDNDTTPWSSIWLSTDGH